MDRVIFDTNAYRYLVRDKAFEEIDDYIEKLKSKESANKIETLFSPIVAKELLAHVASKKDPSYEKCLKAIKALYLHNGNHDSYKMIATPELLISQAFFDKRIPEKEETNKAIGQILYHLAINPNGHVFRKFQRSLNEIKDQVAEGEFNFAIHLKQFVEAVDPSATGWQIFKDDDISRRRILQDIRSEKSSKNIALAFIFNSYQLLVFSGEIQPVENAVLIEMSEKFIQIFPEPIALFKQVMENFTNSEFNLFEDNRANFVWDINLMFNVGNHSVAGSKLYFVTHDRAIIRSAVKENAKYSILDYNEYMEYLGLKKL